MLTNYRITARNKATQRRVQVKSTGLVPHYKSAVKVLQQKQTQREATLQILMAQPEMKVARALSTVPSRQMLLSPEPSAPPAIMNRQVIYVWNQEFFVDIPEGFDIYEGLRMWYPDLYESVMEEESLVQGTPSTPKMTDEEVEEAWAKYDYLEWLSD
jgi:hypothetical protein